VSRLQTLAQAMEAIERRMRRARSLRVASDFDGTLSPLVVDPARARPPRHARHAIRRLARLPGVRVAVLSGRTLADLGARVAVPEVFLAGSGGLETRAPRGSRVVHVSRRRRPPAGLAASLRAWCARFRGAWLEDKGLVFTLHYRAVPARRRGPFVAGVRRRFAPWRRRARLVPAPQAFEILPPGRWDKASALRLWLDGDSRGAALVYFGDAPNDAPALRLASARGGVAVAVGGPVPGARYRVADPAAVVHALERIARAWRRALTTRTRSRRRG
jgi:trehalose 6-phosphate phosphatase